MRPKRILILGGTGLARAAAAALVARGHHVMSSLAGVTQNPLLPAGHLRVGGFGGAEGLTTYLRDDKFDLVVDATHAFAAQISRHAAVAAMQANTPLVRLEAAPWMALPQDTWTQVADVDAAVSVIGPGHKLVVTVGRKEISKFFARNDLSGVARMIEPPQIEIPTRWQVVLERPPFTLESEIDFLREHGATMLISKNAGGPRPAKLDAAAALNIPVIIVARPETLVVDRIATVDELLGRLAREG